MNFPVRFHVSFSAFHVLVSAPGTVLLHLTFSQSFLVCFLSIFFHVCLIHVIMFHHLSLLVPFPVPPFLFYFTVGASLPFPFPRPSLCPPPSPYRKRANIVSGYVVYNEGAGWTVWRREYWMIYRGLGCLAVIWFGSTPIHFPPSPVSKLLIIVSLTVCHLSRFLTGEGGGVGWAWNRIVRPQKSANLQIIQYSLV